MGNAASQTVLMQFYAPLFLIAAGFAYFMATNNPDMLEKSPLPNVIKNCCKGQPIRFGIAIGLIVSLIAVAFRRDVSFQAENQQYFANLLPAEYYGKGEPSLVIPGHTPSHLAGINFRNEL